MRMTYLVHILAGTLGLLTGYVALFAAKGSVLHRRSGRLFVFTMVTMAVFGLTIAVVRGIAPAINIPAATLTFSLVITSLTTVRPLPFSAVGSRLSAFALMVVSLTVGVVMLTWGFEALANGGTRNGMPAFPFFLFGVVGALAGIGDLRVMRSGALTGARRLARHLWRMCVALFIAALSSAVQFGKMIPEPYRVRALLVLPVLAVLVTMFYWLWRVRIRQSLRGIVVRVSVPEAAV